MKLDDKVIVGIDPGKKTGVAVLIARQTPQLPKNVFWPGFKIVKLVSHCFGMDEFPSGVAKLYRGVRKGAPIAVAMEMYTVSRLTQQTQDVQSLEVIGMEHAVRCLLQPPNPITYVKQQVSSAKMLMPNPRLKQMLVPLRMDMPRTTHERDAMRHAMFFLHRYANNSIDMLTWDEDEEEDAI